MLFMLSFILGIASIKETKDFTIIFYAALIFMIISNSLLFIKYTAKTLAIGNVDYKFLLIDKSALKALQARFVRQKVKTKRLAR